MTTEVTLPEALATQGWHDSYSYAQASGMMLLNAYVREDVI